MVLEHVLRFNAPQVISRLAKLSFALGVGDTHSSPETNCENAIRELSRLASSVGLGGKLSDFGISEADLDLLAMTAVEDAVTLNNPVTPSKQDVLEILRRAL